MIEFDDNADIGYDCWADYQDAVSRQDTLEGVAALLKFRLVMAYTKLSRAFQLARLAAANREMAYRIRVLPFADRSDAD